MLIILHCQQQLMITWTSYFFYWWYNNWTSESRIYILSSFLRNRSIKNWWICTRSNTHLLLWASLASDQGKRFRKQIWTRLPSKWLSLTGCQAYTDSITELLDDAQQSTSGELDDLLKVYRYNWNNAGIRTDTLLLEKIL